MGNAQSNGTGNQNQHKLSKPKTNTNSPIGTPKNASPVSVYSKYADLSFARKQHPKTQSRFPLQNEFDAGFSYNGDDGIGELASQVQVHLSMSRSNSVASQNGRNSIARVSALPGSETALPPQPLGVDMNTTLKILQEVRKNTSPDDLAALHQALQPSAASEQALTRRKSVANRSSLSLIRRRSLITTPGLATRNSLTEGSRRSWASWRTPKLGPQDSKWKVDMMGNSPLARIAALDLAEDGRDSPSPRAQTPGDLDYSHLGALKLGSLVVTNGAPSPALSARTIRRSKSNSDFLFQDEDYFSASEPSSTPTMPTLWKSSSSHGHSRSKSSVQPRPLPLHRESHLADLIRKEKTNSSCDSPLKLESRYEPTSDAEPMRLRLQVVNKSAESLARDYMAEMPDSPFCNTVDAATEDADEGFSDPLSDEIPAFREEAFRILDGTIFSESPAAVEMPRPALQAVDAPELRHRERRGRRGRRPTPSKADSGYSSGGSFRIGRGEGTKDDILASPIEEPMEAASLKSERVWDNESTHATSLYDLGQVLALPISQKPLPPIPTGELLSASAREVITPSGLPESWDLAVDKQLARLQMSEKSTFQSICSSTARPAPTTTMSQGTVDSANANRKRVQKRRPSMPDLPVVQSCQPVAEGTIPSVPEPVRAKFVRRLSEAPEMECLTRTYLTDHVNDEECAIDSPTTAISLDFTSPTPSPAPRPRHHRRSHTEGSQSPRPDGVRRSWSLFRGKSETAKPKESTNEDRPTMNVIDLGTIGSSLGRSPYDAAMSDIPLKAVTSPTHPHQLGDGLPRTRSMVNMDDRTASEFGRMRSKERALLRPQMPQRPRSYHDAKLQAPRSPLSYDTSVAVEDEATTDQRGYSGRAPSTGRGPVVTQLVGRYDGYQYPPHQPEQQNWESHACEEVTYDRYSGGYHYGYEGRGYGVGGSAGTRQLHSAASRKSMHYSHQYGVDLSDVPVFVQRIS